MPNGCVLQRLYLGVLAYVTVVLELRQSVVPNLDKNEEKRVCMRLKTYLMSVDFAYTSATSDVPHTNGPIHGTSHYSTLIKHQTEHSIHMALLNKINCYKIKSFMQCECKKTDMFV